MRKRLVLVLSVLVFYSSVWGQGRSDNVTKEYEWGNVSLSQTDEQIRPTVCLHQISEYESSVARKQDEERTSSSNISPSEIHLPARVFYLVLPPSASVRVGNVITSSKAATRPSRVRRDF